MYGVDDEAFLRAVRPLVPIATPPGEVVPQIQEPPRTTLPSDGSIAAGAALVRPADALRRAAAQATDIDAPAAFEVRPPSSRWQLIYSATALRRLRLAMRLMQEEEEGKANAKKGARANS